MKYVEVRNIYIVTCIGIHMRKIYLAEERNLSIHCDGIMCSLIPQVGLEGIEHNPTYKICGLGILNHSIRQSDHSKRKITNNIFLY